MRSFKFAQEQGSMPEDTGQGVIEIQRYCSAELQSAIQFLLLGGGQSLRGGVGFQLEKLQDKMRTFFRVETIDVGAKSGDRPVLHAKLNRLMRDRFARP